jgi:hypothetical protein
VAFEEPLVLRPFPGRHLGGGGGKRCLWLCTLTHLPTDRTARPRAWPPAVARMPWGVLARISRSGAAITIAFLADALHLGGLTSSVEREAGTAARCFRQSAHP